ncbi:MAG: TonB-dependent receptor [bacterium]
MKSKKHSIVINTILSLIFLLSVFPIDLSAQEKTLEEMTIEELMNIEVISASNRMQKLTEAPATIYVITEDDIKQYGYRDLKDVLQHLPGIEYGFPQTHVQGGQRGFIGNWSLTKILINGRPVNSLFSGEAFISYQYTLNNVKQVEIIQGPASALYGADAFIGVINIITKNSENTEEDTDFSFSLGKGDKAFDNKQVSFKIITEKQNLGMALSGTIVDKNGPDFTDFIRTAEYSETDRQLRNEMLDNGNPYRDVSGAYNANADFSYSINDNSKATAGLHFLRNENCAGMESPEISYTNTNVIQETMLTYLTYGNNFSFYPVKLTIDAFHEASSFFAIFQNRTDEGNIPPYLAAMVVENCKLDQVNAQFDITPEDIPNFLIVGFGYTELNIGEPAFTGVSSSDSTLGDPMVGHYLYPPKGYFSHLRPYLSQNKKYAYLQDQHSFFDDKLQITLGARYDYHSIYGGITNLRSGLFFQLLKGWAVKALYGEAFREPTIWEFTSNPDLVPAKMETWELSLHFSPTENIAGQVVYYQNHASKIIQEQRGTGSIDGVPGNIGKKNTTGLESLIKWKLDRFRGDFWYNYEHNPNDPDLFNIAKNKLGFGVIYNITNNISLSLQGKYTDKIKSNVWDEDGNNIIITIPEYVSFNLTFLAQKVNISGFPEMDFSFSIYNLFNRENLFPNMRGPNPSRFLAEGRSFYVSGSIHF